MQGRNAEVTHPAIQFASRLFYSIEGRVLRLIMVKVLRSPYSVRLTMEPMYASFLCAGMDCALDMSQCTCQAMQGYRNLNSNSKSSDSCEGSGD